MNFSEDFLYKNLDSKNLDKILTFLTIDGNSLMNRAFYGVKSLTNSAGQPTNAIYGFLNILLKLINEIKPSYLAVAFDVKAQTFRSEQYKEYKATRQPTPNELLSQFSIIKKILKLMGFVVIEKPGFEADDILGTLAECSKKQNQLKVVVATGDKDLLQLVSENTVVKIMSTKFGTPVTTDYGVSEFFEKFGILPEQFVDVKALMGDKSDNIPGVKGIGEKIAFALISKYQNIENIYQNLETLKEKDSLKRKLAESRELAFLSKDLATICRCVSLDFDLENYRIFDINSEKNLKNQQELIKLLSELEMFSILKKLNLKNSKFVNLEAKNDKNQVKNQKFSQISAQISKQITFDDIGVNSEKNREIFELSEQKESKKEIFEQNISEQIKKSLECLVDKKIFVLINSDDSFVLKLDDKVFCGKDKFVALDMLADFLDSKLGYKNFEKLNNFEGSFEIFTHGAKEFHSAMLSRHQKTFDLKFDTELAGYLLNPDFSSYSLERLFGIYCIELDNFHNNFGDSSLVAKDIMSKFVRLCEVMSDEIQKNNLNFLFEKIELPLSEVLADMELTGFEIDQRGLILFGEKLEEDIEKLRNSIYELSGCEFNINSPKQLSKVLFEDLNLPTGKKNKTGYSTNSDVLEFLKNKHPVVSQILDFRLLSKLKNTYVDGLLREVKKDNKIHSVFNQTETKTGRISSEKPNIQNIPIRTPLGSQLRNFFVARENHKLIDGDYSQIELRILASMANDRNMIEAFLNNQDIHSKTASEVFDVKLDDVSPQMRLFAKSINFGIVYGMSSFSLSKELGISVAEAKKYIYSYFEKFDNIKKYLDETVNKATETGFVSTLFGRKRSIPELSSNNKNIRAAGERIAKNTPIQGTAADIIKIAMIRVYQELKAKKMKSKLIMQIHDELIVEAPVEEVEITKKILEDSMKNAASLKVDLKTDIKTGKNWLEAH